MTIDLRIKMLGFQQLSIGYNRVCIGNDEWSQNLLATFQLHTGHFLGATLPLYENSIHSGANANLAAASSKFLDERLGQSLAAALGIPASFKIMRRNGSMNSRKCPAWPNSMIPRLNR